MVSALGTQAVDPKGRRNQPLSLQGPSPGIGVPEGDPKQTVTDLEADAVVHHVQLSEGPDPARRQRGAFLVHLATIHVFSQSAREACCR